MDGMSVMRPEIRIWYFSPVLMATNTLMICMVTFLLCSLRKIIQITALLGDVVFLDGYEHDAAIYSQLLWNHSGKHRQSVVDDLMKHSRTHV